MNNWMGNASWTWQAWQHMLKSFNEDLNVFRLLTFCLEEDCFLYCNIVLSHEMRTDVRKCRHYKAL